MSECCQLRRGASVVVKCCTCAPEGRPRRKVVEVRPAEKGHQPMVKLDAGVVLQVCDRAPGDKTMPKGRLLIPREYVHRPECPEVDGG